MTSLFFIQVVIFSIAPLMFTFYEGELRRISFFYYISLVLFIGGIFGNLYSFPISEGINISGGNICYGAFMMTSVLFVLVEKDLQIFKQIIRLVVTIDIVNIALSSIVAKTLNTPNVINPHQTSSALFDVSIPFIILGGVLIIVELFFLLLSFDMLKKLNRSPNITAICYLLLFILVLCSDGILFPLIAFGFNAEVIEIVIGGLAGKVLMASVYSLPILLFIICRRRSFIAYLQSDGFQWNHLLTSSRELLNEISAKDYGLKQAETIFKNSSQGLAIINNKGHIVKANAAFASMLKVSELDINSNQLNITNYFQHNNQPLNHTQMLTSKWRSEVSFGVNYIHQGIASVTEVKSEKDKSSTYILSLINIDEQKAIQQQLNHLAIHDQLTELPNRRVLDQRLAINDIQTASLLVIDLDHFKDVNDSYGHMAGDTLLKEVANRLLKIKTTILNPNDLICRTGGDEFALLIDTTDKQKIEEVIKQIQVSLFSVINLEYNVQVFISATIGVSSQVAEVRQDLLQEADAALYQAKRNGRGSFGFYEEHLTQESQRKLIISTKLKKAINEHSLQVFYQPQFKAKSKKIHGVEALVRWNDNELGWVSPAEFIPVAEETGLIASLGALVLEQSCIDGRKWIDMGYQAITISVNISAYQLRFGQFISTLDKVLKQTQYPAQHLELELTETTYIERAQEVTPKLKRIKQRGIKLAIDDFGTGYSSLSYLANMPWDTLKIDRSFITKLPNDKVQCQLTSTIIQLAQAMQFSIVAEGVETQEQLNYLAEKGCDYIQGFYFSPAIQAADIPGYLIQKGRDI